MGLDVTMSSTDSRGSAGACSTSPSPVRKASASSLTLRSEWLEVRVLCFAAHLPS